MFLFFFITHSMPFGFLNIDFSSPRSEDLFCCHEFFMVLLWRNESNRTRRPLTEELYMWFTSPAYSRDPSVKWFLQFIQYVLINSRKIIDSAWNFDRGFFYAIPLYFVPFFHNTHTGYMNVHVYLDLTSTFSSLLILLHMLWIWLRQVFQA